MYSMMRRENPAAFKNIVLLYGLSGAVLGLTGAFFVYFFYTLAGARATLMYLNFGALASVIILKFYNYVVSKLEKINHIIVFSHITYFVADTFVILPFIFPKYVDLFIFLNGFVAGSMFIISQTNIDTYAMKLYNYGNRAKITSLSIVMKYFSAFIILIIAQFLPQNPFLIFGIVESLRAILVLAVLLMPKLEKEKKNARIHSHFLAGKLFFALTGILLVQIALRMTASMKSPVIKEVLGANAIPVVNAFTMITTIFFFLFIMKYTTEYGKIIKRVSFAITIFVLTYFVSKINPITYIIMVAMTPAFMNLAIMSVRHYVIKKVPKKQTHDVLYSVNVSAYAARAVVAIITMFFVASATKYFDIGMMILLTSVAFFVASKFEFAKRIKTIP